MAYSASKAKSEIKKFFNNHYSTIKRKIVFPKDEGKIYEIYCVTELLAWLESRYDVTIQCFGKGKMKFKAGGGPINRKKYPYFKIIDNRTNYVAELHTDIEVMTLGSSIYTGQKRDLSFMHEVDIVLIEEGVKCGDMPTHDQLLLGIECKASAKLRKSVVREVLGIRRELSYFLCLNLVAKTDLFFTLRDIKQFGKLNVPAYPHSLYWLYTTDSNSRRYIISPQQFGIEIKVSVP